MPPAGEAPTFAPQVCWDPGVQRYMETVFGAEHLAEMQVWNLRLHTCRICLPAAHIVLLHQ